MFSKFKMLLLILITIFSAVLVCKVFKLERKLQIAGKEVHHFYDIVDIEYKERFAELLKVYSVSDESGPLVFYRHGRSNDGGYVVPEKAMSMADVLMGYGIADDNSFEEQFSDKYNKPSYGFDCGIDNIVSKNKLFAFVKQCLATDSNLYSDQISNKNISSFSSHIKDLNLEDKKVFIKMDIEGAEYEAFEDILWRASNVTGIVLEIHFWDLITLNKAIKLLQNLHKDFLLVHVHSNNCVDDSFVTRNSIGNIRNTLELTFINKSLVTSHQLSNNQKHPTDLDMPNCTNKSDKPFEILIKDND